MNVIYMLIWPVSIVVLGPLPILLSILSDGSLSNGRTEWSMKEKELIKEGMLNSFLLLEYICSVMIVLGLYSTSATSGLI